MRAARQRRREPIRITGLSVQLEGEDMPDNAAPPTQRLTAILDRQQQCCTALLDLLNREQGAIKGLSLNLLTSIHPEKLALLEDLRTLEEQRYGVVRELAQSWDLTDEDLTLRAIADRASATDAAQLLRMQDRLNQVILAVRDAGNVTSLLLAGSLGFIDQCLSLWRGPSSSVPLYSQAGQLQEAGAGGALLARKG